MTADSDDVTDQSGHTNRHNGMRRGYLGLQFTAGALALIGATWLFGGVAENVVQGDALILVDVGFRAGRSHTWMTGLEPTTKSHGLSRWPISSRLAA